MGNRVLRDRTIPSVYGVGYLGNNLELKTSYDGKICKIYQQWNSMIARCYCKKTQERKPTYIGCYVSDDFKDYSKWREWYDNYQYKYEGWQLDKDLLVKGNKVYSAYTCVFLPFEINVALTKSTKTRGNYFIGVYFDNRKKKFVSRVCLGTGKQKVLGRYDTELEAYLAYKKAKEDYLKELADKYKDLLDPRAYEALYNYTVHIDD